MEPRNGQRRPSPTLLSSSALIQRGADERFKWTPPAMTRATPSSPGHSAGLGTSSRQLDDVHDAGVVFFSGTDFTHDARLKLGPRKPDMDFLGCGRRCDTSPRVESRNLGPGGAGDRSFSKASRTADRGKIWFDRRHRGTQLRFVF